MLLQGNTVQFLRSLLFVIASTISVATLFAQDEPREYPSGTTTAPVRVFILAGQSNMEGRGFPEPLVWQLSQERYHDRYRHFVAGGDIPEFLATVKATRNVDAPKTLPEFRWSVREDVWINYLKKRGNLTVGYGAPKEGFGPEFNFGHVVGEHFDEQILIIKTSWGGRALAKGFLPPSAMPSQEQFEKLASERNQKNRDWNAAQPEKIAKFNERLKKENELAKAAGKSTKRPRVFKPREMVTADEVKAEYGVDYRAMMDEVKTCLNEIGDRFPSFKSQGYELSGFVWFQGWNDQYNDYWLSYEDNMATFIRDVRRELNAPKLPFVIGQMGNGGVVEELKEDSPRAIIKKAQAAVAEYDEFAGNVVCVKTDQYWDMDAHRIYTSPGSWKADIEKWRQYGNDRPYHYYGSPWFFAQVGTAFGEAMLGLIDDK